MIQTGLNISTRPPRRAGTFLNVPARLTGTLLNKVKEIIVIFHIGQLKGSSVYTLPYLKVEIQPWIKIDHEAMHFFRLIIELKDKYNLQYLVVIFNI